MSKTRLPREFKTLVAPKDYVDLKLKIHPNAFTEWVFNEQGQEPNVINNFQNYTNRALTPK